MGRWSLFIDGRRVEAGNFQDVINPSTGGVVGAMPVATAADLDAAVAAASNAFLKWREVADSERAEACRAIARTIEENSEELARLLTIIRQKEGKPGKAAKASDAAAN